MIGHAECSMYFTAGKGRGQENKVRANPKLCGITKLNCIDNSMPQKGVDLYILMCAEGVPRWSVALSTI